MIKASKAGRALGKLYTKNGRLWCVFSGKLRTRKVYVI
jgi:hypothetical protein